MPPEEQAEYAQRAGTTVGYLRKAISKGQRFDGALARRLDEESRGVVSRYRLRPDVFGPPPANDDPTPEAHPPRRRRTAVKGEAAATDGGSVSGVKEVRDAA